jgi:hypothetical protein
MFIQDDFHIPDHLVTDQFRLVVLEPNLAALDYEAVMSSKERLKHVFAENDDWPEDSMTFEFNKNDLVIHEKEFRAKEAFAYAVFSSSKDRYIGCVYVNPSDAADYDCEVYLWVRDSEIHLDEPLFKSVDNWLQTEWQFKRRAYPGRTIAWADWASQGH